MDRALYIAMSGAVNTMRSQAVTANNLANLNTIGFKKDFSNYMDMQVNGGIYPSRAFSVNEGSKPDFSPGQMIVTGRDLDVAVQGNGFIAVQVPDGSEAYTRSGSLNVSQNGILTSGQGYPVVGNDGAIIAIPPSEKIEIGGDGTITILPIGQDATSMAVVDRIKLVNPEYGSVNKGDDGLFYISNTNKIEPDASVSLVTGNLESSNVNGITEMVNMITNARLFESQIKVMTAVKENDTASSKLLRLS